MKTRTWISALVGASLVATVGLAATATSSNADVAVGVGPSVPLGSGTLTWKASGTTASVAYSGAPTATPQTISGRNCVATTTVGTQYLLFGVTGPDVSRTTKAGVGFKDLSLGVRSGNDSNGTACKQVNLNTTPRETLIIKTNPEAFGTTFGTPSINEARLDLNLSGNAVVVAELVKNGSVIGKAEMQSGFSAPQTVQDPTSQLFICNFRSNSGPQSGFNNNCYWHIRPLQAEAYPEIPGYVASPGGWTGAEPPANAAATDYDEIRLTPIVGDFSIQGGTSWPTTLPGSAGTTFGLALFSDGSLACYDPANPATLAAAQAAAFGDGRAVVTRLKLGNNGECVLKPYTYSDVDNSSTFRYPRIAGQETSQFAIRLPRDYTAAQAAGYPPLPPSTVNWEDTSGDKTLRTCVPGLITGVGNDAYKLPTVDYTKLVSGLDQTGLTGGIQYACIYAQTSEVTPSGGLIAYDFIYFHGDVKFKAL